MDYGERRAIAGIEKLPKGTWSYETCHDPVPGVDDDGLPVKDSVTVDLDAGEVTVDARDNIDCVPGGINFSEACASASCRIDATRSARAAACDTGRWPRSLVEKLSMHQHSSWISR